MHVFFFFFSSSITIRCTRISIIRRAKKKKTRKNKRFPHPSTNWKILESVCVRGSSTRLTRAGDDNSGSRRADFYHGRNAHISVIFAHARDTYFHCGAFAR